jgi:hypothetical protein
MWQGWNLDPNKCHQSRQLPEQTQKTFSLLGTLNSKQKKKKSYIVGFIRDTDVK